MVEIKPLIKSWNENNLKNFPMTAGGFHTPGNSKICFFCLIYDLNKTTFLLDIIYAKHHINTHKSLK